MIGRSSLLSFSRRRVLITTSAAVALVAIAGLVPAQGADRSRDGGDITFLIDSLRVSGKRRSLPVRACMFMRSGRAFAAFHRLGPPANMHLISSGRSNFPRMLHCVSESPLQGLDFDKRNS